MGWIERQAPEHKLRGTFYHKMKKPVMSKEKTVALIELILVVLLSSGICCTFLKEYATLQDFITLKVRVSEMDHRLQLHEAGEQVDAEVQP